ncbi:hypothetical protein [Amycolatopsis granulosa]|uniref:hypothetical protein n=1 Tax=Amycolatopsis granulosa TaxID=185684 RepID=UPI001422590E|nr:hypothetical protein [Amycolatopsis granulosa]NIH86125.1 hypothetical protein [Amycolatopsis granulosa]
MKFRRTATVLIGLTLVSAAFPATASAAKPKLSCVKAKVHNGWAGDDATATNKCAGSVQVKFMINNDFDSGWRTVKPGKSTTYGYAAWGGFDGLQIKYRGKEYFNPG